MMKGASYFFIAVAVSVLTASEAARGFEDARSLYYAGIDGDSDAARRSAKLMDDLASARPKDALIQAYRGSNRLLEAARTLVPWKKGRLAREGLEALDGAVAVAPDDLEIRFLRAISTYHLPAFFKREEQSKQDFAILAKDAESAAAEGRLEPRLASAALYHHGVFLERQKDLQSARRAWAAAARIAPEARAGRDASNRLKQP